MVSFYSGHRPRIMIEGVSYNRRRIDRTTDIPPDVWLDVVRQLDAMYGGCNHIDDWRLIGPILHVDFFVQRGA